MAFTVVGATLSEPGLRVLMEVSGEALEVVARGVPGGPGELLACPVEGVSGDPGAAGCVPLEDGRTASMSLGGGATGVLLRSSGGPVRVAEVTLLYVPVGDRITLVTPPLDPPATPGECPGGACEIAFELSPTGPGTLVLEAHGRGARPQLTVQAGLPAGPSRVLSIVEGGGRLAVRSTVDGRADARLTVRNLGAMELPPLEIALTWPVPR